MTIRPPAEIGMPLDEVDTPALVIDLDAFPPHVLTSAAQTYFNHNLTNLYQF